MTTLVTGATGRVGSRFVPRLLRAGEPVRILARDAARAEPLQRLGAEVVLGDLRDGGTIDDAVKGADAVVHLGAAFLEESEGETAAVNHGATVALAEAALRGGAARFVFAGTTLVYGVGRPDRPSREDDEPTPPPWPYPTTKIAAERDLRALYESDRLPLRVMRLAFVYGEGDPHLAESLEWAREWPPHKRLQTVHHADVAQALLRALRADGADGEIFNVADDAPVTAYELMELNGETLPDGAADRPLDHPWESIADTAKIRRVLGYRPIHPTVASAREAGAL